VSPKDTIEWGFRSSTNDDWVIVDKSVLNDMDIKSIDKRMGFEGKPDPKTGYYCFYNEGRLVNGEKDSSSSASAYTSKPRK
jgi:hypothetical protein